MIDPITEIHEVSPVLRTPAPLPTLAESLDNFFSGVKVIDTDPNKLVSDYSTQMRYGDQVTRALMNPALLGPAGEDPKVQKLMQLNLEAALQNSQMMQKKFAGKVESGIATTKVKHLTAALSKAMSGLTQLLQAN